MSRLYIPGRPQIGTETRTGYRRVLVNSVNEFLAGGRTISGACSRDPGNTDLNVLRAGLLMGKIVTPVNSLGTAGYYAPSIFGPITNAEAAGSTQLEATAAIMAEIVRRVGATGSVKLLGPPTASGVVRTLTFAYSAISSTNMTVTALGANQVDQIDLSPASTGGNIKLTVQKTDGTFVTTANAAWNATDATYLAAINTQLDASTGVSGGIVASAIPAVDTDLGFRLTYSGTGYAGLPWTAASVNTLPTSSTAWSTWRVTTAIDSRFVAGSLLMPTDGSENFTCWIPDGTGVNVFDLNNASQDQDFTRIPVKGLVDPTKLLPVWPSDTSLRQYIIDTLCANGLGSWQFTSKY